MANRRTRLRKHRGFAFALLELCVTCSDRLVPPPSSSPVTLIGAGDIARCGLGGDEATAHILDSFPDAVIFTAGDNAYPKGTLEQFLDCYNPSWGRYKNRTWPAPGNHEYGTLWALGYHWYFGSRAGPWRKGYYSYDAGDWHVIALNSVIATQAGSVQERWLRNDLAAHPRRCTLAYWHEPRFSSGPHGNAVKMRAIWQALYEAGASVVVNGHDHTYERFAPQTPDGVADSVHGIREFVVGTGGANHHGLRQRQPNSEAFDSTSFGVLKLTLFPTSYTWEFLPIAGQHFHDAGAGTCRSAPD